MAMTNSTDSRGSTAYAVAERTTPQDLPMHETAVCPKCEHTGVMMRGDVCECYASDCGYRWRWPFVASMGLD